MTQTILMLQGPPGCGKSHLAEAMVAAEPGTWARVNKDDIRLWLKANWGIDWSPAIEQSRVIPERDARIMTALKAGKSVIVDDTNLAGNHEERLRALAVWMGCTFKIQRIDLSLEECISRDADRPNPVGEKVVRRHYANYERIVQASTVFTPTPVEHIPGLPDAIICDLDGTLAERGDRGIYDFEKCAADAVKWPVQSVLWEFWGRLNTQIIFMSGREEKYRPQTLSFLTKARVDECGPLYMRATGDRRNDAVVKFDLFNQHIRGKYNVLFTLDDRDRVVKMWRDMGLTCMQVAEGNF